MTYSDGSPARDVDALRVTLTALQRRAQLIGDALAVEVACLPHARPWTAAPTALGASILDRARRLEVLDVEIDAIRADLARLS